MLKAGEYYVGDLCYVLHEEWDEVCGLLFAGRDDHGCNQGEFNLKDGRRFAIYNTYWGDGTYSDQSGRKYDVDAGSIGCILVSDIDLDNPQNFLSGGQVVKFNSDFNTSNDEGTLIFGSTRIETRSDTDDYYYDNEEELYDE